MVLDAVEDLREAEREGRIVVGGECRRRFDHRGQPPEKIAVSASTW
jgi:hypothetical protein